MPTKEEMLKGLDALESLLNEQSRLAKDGLMFIFEKGLWQDFMKYHAEEHVRRSGHSRLTSKDIKPEEANMI